MLMIVNSHEGGEGIERTMALWDFLTLHVVKREDVKRDVALPGHYSGFTLKSYSRQVYIRARRECERWESGLWYNVKR